MSNCKKILILAAIISLSLNYNAAYSQSANDNNQPSSTDQVSGHVEKKNTTNEKAAVNILLNPVNPLGMTNAENKIKDVTYLINNNKLVEASVILVPTVDWLNDATEFHTNLYKTLKDIDSAKVQADLERDLALRYAILRDQASYQMAILYIHQKKLKNAADKLVDIVRSQPTTKLGFDAYQKLEDIGFTYKVQFVDQSPPSANQ